MYILKWYDGKQIYCVSGNNTTIWQIYWALKISKSIEKVPGGQWAVCINDCGNYCNLESGRSLPATGEQEFKFWLQKPTE